MARISRTDLNNAVDHVNAKMEMFNSSYRFAAQSRNGYTAVDVYKDGRCLFACATGTPRECIGGLYSTAFDYIPEPQS